MTFLFLGISIAPSIAIENLKKSSIPISSGNTLYVGGSGEGNYSKIQDAIDNATDGYTVFVYNGTYYENIETEKSINLIGENRETTVIDGGGYHFVVSFRNMYLAEYVSVQEFTIQNGRTGITYDTGINNLNKTTHLISPIHTSSGGFSNNIIINNEIGISIGWRSENIYIVGNNFFNNSKGINLDTTSWYNGIFNNFISENNYGICADGSLFNFISENIITLNKNDGMYFRSYCDSNEIKNNIICNNNNGIFFDYNCSGNIISDNNISSNEQKGIVINHSNSNIIEDNILIKNSMGIYLYYSSYNQIKNNYISNQKHDAAIRLYYLCNKNTVNFNILSNNEVGLILFRSLQNNITGNKFSENAYGLYMYEESKYNMISRNIFKNRYYGIIVGNPILLTLSINDFLDGSNFNKIINNNFCITQNEHAIFDGCWKNIWKQNYWGRPRVLPKIIYGGIFLFPFYNIDWHPAKEPYEI